MNTIPNLWTMTLDQIRLIPFGSKVVAGSYGGEGIFLGVNKNGVVVVAWDDTVERLGNQIIPKLVKYALS
jgi:hypothetical protein